MKRNTFNGVCVAAGFGLIGAFVAGYAAGHETTPEPEVVTVTETTVERITTEYWETCADLARVFDMTYDEAEEMGRSSAQTGWTVGESCSQLVTLVFVNENLEELGYDAE